MPFSEYSDFYDLYYEEKDYSAEVDFVLSLASRFGISPKSVLDMGCGTGRHLLEFSRRGLECDGFDLSTTMLAQAKMRLSEHNAILSAGNLTDFDNGKQYDLVVSMFAVMGYLVDNDQLIMGLKTAAKHLRQGGVFVFDGWFGPAVLAQSPEVRRHEYRKGEDVIIREATPTVDARQQSVTVHYSVTSSRDGEITRRIDEDHSMRFMFVQEMALAMDIAGLKLVHTCPFMEPESQLTAETWNVTFVASAKIEDRREG
jgi:SAM-dependent methyltransferase